MASLVVSIRGRELRTIPIESPTMTIGRDQSCDVTIDNIGVSRVHATVWFDGKGFSVEDAGSSNGIFINGKRAQQFSQLNIGDEIMVLKHTVKLIAAGGADTTGGSFVGVAENTKHPQEQDSANPVQNEPAQNKPVQHTMRISDDDLSRLMLELQKGSAKSEEGPNVVGVSPVFIVATLLWVLLGLAVVVYFATR